MDYTDWHHFVPISSISSIIFCNCSLETGTGKGMVWGWEGYSTEEGLLLPANTAYRPSDESENSLNMTVNGWYFVSFHSLPDAKGSLLKSELTQWV